MIRDFSGLYTALVTPFYDQKVDLESLKKLVRFQLENGVQGFVVNGTTGESPTVTKEERRLVFDLVRSEATARVPILFGAGTFSTKTTIEMCQEGELLGADGLLLVTPYYNKPPQRGLIQHFESVAKSTRLPCVLYNVPSRTGVSMTVETVEALSRVPNIVGIKEATGDLQLGEKIAKSCGAQFLVTSGDDGTSIDLALRGARGVISVTSHIFPKAMREFLDRARRGDKSAAEEFKKYSELTSNLFIESNPIPVKAALKEMGILRSDELRLPLVTIEESKRKILVESLRKLGIV